MPLFYSQMTDVNECLMNVCTPLATCENQLGSFACICKDGFAGDGLINGTNCTGMMN